MDFVFGQPETWNEFLIVGVLEVLLLAIGILIALKINNWNEERKENLHKLEMMAVLIADLEHNKDEICRDLDLGNMAIVNFNEILINSKKVENIGPEIVEGMLQFLSMTYAFFEANPTFNRIVNSTLWEKLPKRITTDLHEVYYDKIGFISVAYKKHVEYATHCKLEYLKPNNLLNPNLTDKEKLKIVTNTHQEFIQCTELMHQSVTSIIPLWEVCLAKIEALLPQLENYINSID